MSADTGTNWYLEVVIKHFFSLVSVDKSSLSKPGDWGYMITLATWNPPTLCENFTSHKWLHLLKSWLLGKFLFRFHRFLAVYPHVDRSSRTVKPTASLSWSVPIIQHTDLRLALWSILELKKEPRHWCPRYPKLLQHATVPCVEFWGAVCFPLALGVGATDPLLNF